MRRPMESFDKALQLDPSHRKSLFNSGRVLLEAGRAKDALERIQKGLELEPMSNEGLRLLGRARYELAQVDEAIKAYQRALTMDENDVWSMNNLGLIYIQQGRSAEAIPVTGEGGRASRQLAGVSEQPGDRVGAEWLPDGGGQGVRGSTGSRQRLFEGCGGTGARNRRGTAAGVHHRRPGSTLAGVSGADRDLEGSHFVHRLDDRIAGACW